MFGPQKYILYYYLDPLGWEKAPEDALSFHRKVFSFCGVVAPWHRFTILGSPLDDEPPMLKLGRSSSLSIKIAQKPYVRRSLGPKALEYGPFEGKGQRFLAGRRAEWELVIGFLRFCGSQGLRFRIEGAVIVR